MDVNADEIQRALDNGHMVILYRNALDTYTACAFHQQTLAGESLLGLIDQQFPGESDKEHLTDDFTPAKALHRLSEAMIGNVADFGN